MSQSFWFEDVPDTQKYPALEGDIRADVCIVGGGIAGVSAAYHIVRAGKSVVLLEANNLATGDSGFTTAFATHFLDTPEATAQGYRASEDGIQLFREIIKREKFDCDWKDVDAVAYSQGEGPDALRKNFDAVRAVDPNIEWLAGDDARRAAGFPVTAAFRKPTTEGQFHIRKFLIPLAERASKQGAAIFESSEVVTITPGKEAIIKTAKGSVRAHWLVVASGPPSGDFFPAVAQQLSGAITFVIQASYPKEKPCAPALFWDYLHPYHYFRWLSETDLILGGEDRPIRGKSVKDPHQTLEAWLRGISGTEFSIVNKWQGTIFYTPDGLPFVGPHRDYGENIIFATGWGGNGMAHGLLAGQIAADLVQKKENPHAKTFSFERL